MTLTDTGPLVALLDRDDANHTVCVAAAKQLPSGPMLTSWPCFVEAMYLLGAVGGFGYQSELWKLYSADRLLLHDFSATSIQEMYAMQCWRSFTLVALCVSTLSFAVTTDATAADLTDAEFRRLHSELQPAADEPWRTIPWKIALLDAQNQAAKERKPIFIWAMDGHPLGCT